ncbi:hypothetical protein ABZZ17_08635 [Streptomyces sp. NPDC006512]|uniref:hypothetical protein n=1 Tax=Streptomyces sp. NPDC006512 TaxID=3154307 RepID=UPI0033A06336
MSGARFARAVPARVLTVACVVLLCLFGAGPAAATVAESRPASTAPAEPTEGQSDPASDPESRAALRAQSRALPAVRQLPPEVFHVKHTGGRSRVTSYGTTGPATSLRAVRSVVLRC